MKTIAKRFLALSITAGFLLVATPAFADSFWAGPQEVKYPTPKSPNSLQLSVYIKNGVSKLKIVKYAVRMNGTTCTWTGTPGNIIEKGPTTLSKRILCGWTEIAALSGCGPKKASCDVTLSGKLTYQNETGDKTTFEMEAKTLSVSNPGLLAAPLPSK